MSKKTTNIIIGCVVAIIVLLLFGGIIKNAFRIATWDLARFFSKIIVWGVKVIVVLAIVIGVVCLVLRIAKGPKKK